MEGRDVGERDELFEIQCIVPSIFLQNVASAYLLLGCCLSASSLLSFYLEMDATGLISICLGAAISID